MALLHSLDQDNQNEVHHDFFDHVIPLASHDGVTAESMAPLHTLGQDD